MPCHASTGDGECRTAPGARCRAFLLATIVLLTGLRVGACRYNVRDLGFIDLEAAQYRLHVVPGAASTAEQTHFLRGAAELAFRDSNLALDLHEPGFVPGADDAWRTAWPPPAEFRGTNGSQALLVAPDGSAFPVALGDWDERLGDRLTGLVRSPVRDALVSRAAEGYAAVLLVEGAEAAANERATRIVRDTILEVQNQMRWLPKPIAHPPALVTLSRADRAKEGILIWALGAELSASTEPAVAIIYGKARRIGEVLKGDQIREAALQRVFTTIGADCECGLDLSWTRGKSLPVLWSPARHTQVAKSLGFDPENPAVKLEATQILGKRAKPTTPGLGYQEISLEEEPPKTPADTTGTPDAGPATATAPPRMGSSPNPRGDVTAGAEGEAQVSSRGMSGALTVLAVVSGAVILGGVVMLIRARSHDA